MAAGMLKRISTTTTRKRGIKPRRKVNKPSKQFIKNVQAIIHKNAETKQAFHERATASYNSGINSIGDCTRVLPNVSKSDDDNGRDGDQITGMSLTVKGAVVYNPSTGQYGTYGNSRLGVRMMIIQPRQYSNLDDVQNNAGTWLTYLLKKGGTTATFTGALSDLWAPINSDAIIKYYDKVFYMDAPYQLSNVGSVLMGNSTRMFSISLKVKGKVLKYETSVSGGIQPTNYAPVLVLGYAHMDGSSPDTLTTALQLTYDTILNYEDI